MLERDLLMSIFKKQKIKEQYEKEIHLIKEKHEQEITKIKDELSASKHLLDIAVNSYKNRDKGCFWCSDVVEATATVAGITVDSEYKLVGFDESETIYFCPLCGRGLEIPDRNIKQKHNHTHYINMSKIIEQLEWQTVESRVGQEVIDILRKKVYYHNKQFTEEYVRKLKMKILSELPSKNLSELIEEFEESPLLIYN